MAELSTIARPYAEAAFATAKDSALDLEAWSKSLQDLSDVVALSPVREVLSNPLTTREQRLTVFETILPELPQELKNVVRVLIDNDRWQVMPELAGQFEALKNQHEGVAVAQITSAFELSEAQLEALLATLQTTFATKLKAEVTVDSALIGGVRVVVGDHVLDTSVQAQLARLHDTLVAE